ncbi:phasin family protein [uncultured Rhodoblastus sp.]|uniref:phasin family protein n=1 Tax=uncultured Rhodoblastus sp. TaxID=543037 RepID=UPI0025FADBAA|nr:phasin family protein [uncultured Rhodoblastus sp.]
MPTRPRKTSKPAAKAVSAPEGAPVAEPETAVVEHETTIAEPLKAIVEAVKAVAAETAEQVKTFDPAKALESVKALDSGKTKEIVAEVAKVQQAAKEAVTETVHALEGSFGAASKSLQAFSAKALEAYQANAVASVSYLQALSGVRSISEAIALQSEHARKQYENLSAQAKELTALAQQVASDAAGPFKDQIGKVFKPK